VVADDEAAVELRAATIFTGHQPDDQAPSCDEPFLRMFRRRAICISEAPLRRRFIAEQIACESKRILIRVSYKIGHGSS
jgi:hypothetical protein